MTASHAKRGKHFISSACALHGRPYDGHTLAPTLGQIKRIVGSELDESYADKGYKGHKLKGPTRIILSGQKRGITKAMKQQMKRQSVIEPIIDHAKNDDHLGRLACLRHQDFYSLEGLNKALRVLADQLNSEPFQKLPGCRLSQFKQLQLDHLN
jgi:hypothetical protein